MTKFLLVNSPVSLKDEFGVLSKGGSYRPPVQLAILAAVLRSKGIEVEILDCLPLNLDYQSAADKIIDSGIKYVGITATTLTIYNASKLAEIIKNKRKDIQIIVGGAHITIKPEDTLKRFPAFDIGIVGEGEFTLVELIESLARCRTLKNIKGIAYRMNNHIKLTNCRPFIEKLDILPFPAWDLLPNLNKFYQPALMRHVRLPSAYILTSRGCPYKCTFCAGRAILGRTFRFHSIDYVMEMIYQLKRNYGIKDLTIYDELLTVNNNRINAFCDRLLSKKIDLTWSCDSRVDIVTLPLLKKMYKAGCRNISYGIESGSQEVLDAYKKGITLSQIKDALGWTKEAGIATSGFFMFGAPNETKQTMQETISLIRDIDLDYYTPFFYTPQPGDEIYDKANSYGIFDDDWTKMNGLNAIFIPYGLTKKQLEWYFKKSLAGFYLRPTKIISYLKRVNSFTYFLRMAMAAISLFFILFKRKLSK